MSRHPYDISLSYLKSFSSFPSTTEKNNKQKNLSPLVDLTTPLQFDLQFLSFHLYKTD